MKNWVSGSKILIVGLCCIDEVNFVDKFPLEDSDTRIFEQTVTLGGNACNNTTVLRQLDENCELFASIPSNHQVLEKLITASGINVENCIRKDGVEIPKSTVILNRQNGSRTILHYRGSTPEFMAEEFIKTFGDKLHNYGWIHFEGRNCDEVRGMMEYLRSRKTKDDHPKISVELEKLRPYPFLEQLIPLADVIFVSKDYAGSKGWKSMADAISGIQAEAPLTTVICTWGEQGASGRETSTSKIMVQAAFKQSKVVDTLAAGDCFLGACLNYLNKNRPLEEVLESGCRIAGGKCGRVGLLDLDI